MGDGNGGGTERLGCVNCGPIGVVEGTGIGPEGTAWLIVGGTTKPLGKLNDTKGGEGEDAGGRLVGGRGDKTTERPRCVITGPAVCEVDDVGIKELDQDGDHTGIVEVSVITVVVVVFTTVGVEDVVGSSGLEVLLIGID